MRNHRSGAGKYSVTSTFGTQRGRITCFTAGAAYAEFAEDRRGVLRPGMDADLTAFDRDVLSVAAAELTKLRVTHTFVGGRDELARRWLRRSASLH